ncbi:ATP-binding protein [Streptomyces rubiginosohelvolus]|uniref:ATP-binding protein n=1 Tax=Streptomyces rubiginosohelvolus TaxID=67362 RepID=UPI003717F498
MSSIDTHRPAAPEHGAPVTTGHELGAFDVSRPARSGPRAVIPFCGLLRCHSFDVSDGAPVPPPASPRAPARRAPSHRPESHSLPLVREDDAVGGLRNWITGHLRRWRLGHLTDDFRLIATELATNAARHGHAPARVTLTRLPGAYLRIAVTDAGPGFDPEHIRTSWGSADGLEDCHGRGLMLVDALSTSWGADRLPLGQRVWAEFAAC